MMTDPGRHLHLAVPGLFGPLPQHAAQTVVAPEVPFLETLLARATVAPFPGLGAESLVFALFGLEIDKPADLPCAAVTRLVDGGEPDSHWWLRADPVHLHADGDRLLLFDVRRLDIHLEEARWLAAQLNGLYREQGWNLEALHPERWYLRLPPQSGLRTHPLSRVVGCNIDPFLPFGAQAQEWRGLLNEAQMLLHRSDVNQHREERGVVPINSLWFWGGGSLPEAPPARFASIKADDPLAHGLAILTGSDWRPLNERDAHLDRPGDHLVVDDSVLNAVMAADPDAWGQACEALESAWLELADELIRVGTLNSLTLYPGNGLSYRLSNPGLSRFWRRRRRRPLSEYLTRVQQDRYGTLFKPKGPRQGNVE